MMRCLANSYCYWLEIAISYVLHSNQLLFHVGLDTANTDSGFLLSEQLLIMVTDTKEWRYMEDDDEIQQTLMLQAHTRYIWRKVLGFYTTISTWLNGTSGRLRMRPITINKILISCS